MSGKMMRVTFLAVLLPAVIAVSSWLAPETSFAQSPVDASAIARNARPVIETINPVIHTPGQRDTRNPPETELEVAIGETTRRTLIGPGLFQFPQSARLAAAWYVPIDNVRALTNFNHINIHVRGNEVLLEASAASAARLRLRVYVMYFVDGR